MTDTKFCERCELWVPKKECMQRKPKCLACKKIEETEARAAKTKAKRESEMKHCKGCDQDKLKYGNFRRGQQICKDCETKNVVINKVCIACNIEKPSTEYRHNNLKCMDCKRHDNKMYRRKNPELGAKWHEENKERHTELQKNYYEKNKEKIRRTESERYHTEPNYAMCLKFRRAASGMVRGDYNRTKYVNVTREFYITWLASMFGEDMSMNNYGELWCIDHVIPLDCLMDTGVNTILTTYIESTGSKYLLGRWFNTQPLLRLDNRLKDNIVDSELLETHCNRVQEFMKTHADMITSTDHDEYKDYCKLVAYVKLMTTALTTLPDLSGL